MKQNGNSFLEASKGIELKTNASDPTVNGQITFNGTVFRKRQGGVTTDLDSCTLTLVVKSSTIITTGLKAGSVTTNKAGNWSKWTLTTDEANSTAVVNIRKNGTLIFTTNKPALTNQKNNSGTNMSGTTTAYAIGDYFEIEIVSNNNSKGLTITLE